MKRRETRDLNCRRLTFEDRKRFEGLYGAGLEVDKIARLLNIHLSTVYREIARGYTGTMDANGRSGYSAEIAQQTTLDRLKHKKINGD